MKQRMITLKIPLVGSIIFLLIIGGIFMGNYWNFWNLAKQEIKAIINQEDRANLLGSNACKILQHRDGSRTALDDRSQESSNDNAQRW